LNYRIYVDENLPPDTMYLMRKEDYLKEVNK